jgi:hypothetical protein
MDVLGAGRTSRLVSGLVLRDRKLLLASADAAYPGEKHAGLAVVYARPSNGQSYGLQFFHSFMMIKPPEYAWVPTLT